ncbi:uncharacterized protein TA07635 [Theileria annulata]|uniref:DNA-directed RNA polymerase III subunit RPC3 n=1 Tax=Theileria annulata TaxID=5874 RepID=Q4UA23_THEAN|nr:uncharacterized protein TA07635 [Theileria annulata]CAI76330.1 hypothetical protein, conserved [Theileria annulata]|eukprot:XP_952954.1 hypothetical protein, conserved [Theileria annulata]
MYLIEYDLVLYVIEYYFGRLTSRVTSQLLLRGPISLPKLVNPKKFNFKVFRNALVILIRHGIVEYSFETTTIGPRLVTHLLYSVNINNALSMFLIPSILLNCKEQLDDDCYKVLLHISKYGITTPRKIKESLPELGNYVISNCLFNLINSHFIVPVDSFDQLMNKQKGHEYPCDGIFDVLETLTRGTTNSSAGPQCNIKDNQLYKIDFEFALENLVKEEIKQLIYSRVGNNASIKIVLDVLMDNNTRKWPKILHYRDIESRIRSLKNTQNITSDYLMKLLNGLNKHPDNLVVYSPQDQSYYLDWYKARRMLKEMAIFESVKRLLGIRAARIWNLLLKELDNDVSSKLDTHQVSENALVSLQTARSILYRLTMKGFAKIYESAPKASDKTHDLTHQPQDQSNKQTVYFSTSLELVCKLINILSQTHSQIMKMGYKFASNLIERLVHEKNMDFQRYKTHKSQESLGI